MRRSSSLGGGGLRAKAERGVQCSMGFFKSLLQSPGRTSSKLFLRSTNYMRPKSSEFSRWLSQLRAAFLGILVRVTVRVLGLEGLGIV